MHLCDPPRFLAGRARFTCAEWPRRSACSVRIFNCSINQISLLERSPSPLSANLITATGPGY